ncbi:MAG: beta-N-acetylhexosaminidase [Armatimonadetes bacterium]|nr:beta-N-acetylhexosaminidase [Armatimonadota bacterium]
MMIPRPQELRTASGAFHLSDGTGIACGDDPRCRAEGEYLRERIRDLTGLNLSLASGAEASAREGSILLHITENLPGVAAKEEGYLLTVAPGGVRIEAAGDGGLFYGCESFTGLLQRDGERWLVPSVAIRDWPDFRWRGLLVDPARRFIPMPLLKQYVDLMARGKLNVLHVHFTDNESYTLESKRFPALNEWLDLPIRSVHSPDRFFGVYTHKDLKELVAYAERRKVTIVPEIGTPSHAAHIVALSPELRCRVADGYASETVLCAGSEKTYQVLEAILDEIAPFFPGKVFHIGTDELDCSDIVINGKRVYCSSWDDCSVCRERVRREGIAGHRQLFYYFANRVKGLLDRHGKRLMMWSDPIDIASPHDLSTEILVHFFRIANVNWGPRRHCSYDKLLKAGFEVVNSHWPDTYANEAPFSERNLAEWHPALRPYVPPGLEHRVAGATLCAWGGPESFYLRMLPPAIAMFGDRCWHKGKVDDPGAFARALPRHLFGPRLSPALGEMLIRLGSILPPATWNNLAGDRAFRYEDRPLPAGAVKDAEECRAVEELIAGEIRKNEVENANVLAEYLETFRWVREELV